MKRTLLFMTCMLASVMMLAEAKSSDYIPFVEKGKTWHVVCPSFDRSYHFEQYMLTNEEVVENGKTYVKMNLNEDGLFVLYDAAFLREENRKVYIFIPSVQKEFLVFDYSLKAGDTYEGYSVDVMVNMSYKVISVEDYLEGPEIVRNDQSVNGMVTQHRYLRKWTVCRTDDNSIQKTWIEGVGSLNGPLGNLYDIRYLNSDSQDYLAYVITDFGVGAVDINSYLPFPFHDKFRQVHGCNLPTGETYHSEDWHHLLTYELEGDRLHVYGKAYTQCGLNNYAYFYEKPTDDPSIHKVEFEIQGVEPIATCAFLHAIDFYVSGFDPNLNYIVVDNQGEEHPVTKKAPELAYRPLVVEGKHWTYDNYMPLRPAEYDHYYYYDLRGDTLISGKKCLKMYSENRANDGIVRYEGALYEESKKVYCFFPGKDEAELLYDFDCKVGDTLQIYYPYNYQVLVKDIQTEDNGGIDVKKYTLKIIWDYEEEYVVWIEGVGAMLDFFGMVPAAGNYNSLNACELNGEKLYQYIEPDLTAKGYHKMGIEGKRWNYIHYYLDEDGEHRAPYSYVVKGDTVIRRTTYKKLWYQDEKTERLVCLLLEQGRSVMKSLDFGDNSYDQPLMKFFFEFDRDDFGRVFSWKSNVNSGNTNWMPYGVDTIEVKGQPFRRYTCLQKYSEEGETLTTIAYDGEGVWRDIWVEGVGSASSGIEDQIPFHEPPVRTPGEYTYFVSCYENGECIFTAEDFNIQAKPVTDIAYRPFVEDGKVWKVGGDESGNPVRRVEYYFFDGDTIINGKTCKQMMCQRYVSPGHPDYNMFSRLPSLSYVGAWYEEDKKVFLYNADNKQFNLMYDFSVDTNETLQIHNRPYVVGPRQMGDLKGFKGVYRDVMWPWDGEQIYNTTWLEGVGNIDGPIYGVYLGEEGHALFLMSCTVGDEVIYFNDEYEDGATPEELNARKQRIDFTHIIKIKPKSRTKREAEPSLYGEYSEQQLGINLNPLDDAYVVRITDESGRVVYEKTVNAGNIVGLNIDISDYAEGRYTVTVENDNESFTGEIDTRTTGIKENGKNEESKDGNIYNLQGQRISALRKGLNIVNGRKVFIK